MTMHNTFEHVTNFFFCSNESLSWEVDPTKRGSKIIVKKCLKIN